MKMIKAQFFLMKKNQVSKKAYINIEQHCLLWTLPTDPWCNMLLTLKIPRKIGDRKLSVGHTLFVLIRKFGLSPSKKKMFYLIQWKSFKNDEKCFLFYLKSSFRSQDIQIFVWTFWSCRKCGLIRKIRLISEFMTSQFG